MFEQHCEPVGRNAGATAYSRAESIDAWLGYMDRYLLNTLLRYEDAATLDPVERFIAALRPGDAIVTFNYDRLVERCLEKGKLKWTFAIEDQPQAGAIPVFKMHGSLDWVCFARDQPRNAKGLRRIFSKKDANREQDVRVQRSGEFEFDFELYHANDELIRSYTRDRSLIQGDHAWGVAGLGPRKRVSLVPGLGVVWDRARHALYRTQEIIIVGFSFSTYDRLAQVEFARIMAARDEIEESPPRVIVIDPSLCASPRKPLSRAGHALIERVQTVFRPVTTVGLVHEAFDWGQLG
jgi:hypothetical protein